MNALQQRINALEAEVVADKLALSMELRAVKNHMATPLFLIPALAGFFCLGYFMPHRKHISGTIPLTLIKNLKTILPLIIA